MNAQDAITVEQAAQHFAAEVAYWREVRGMSKRTLAKLMGFHPSYVSHIESGRHNPTGDFARRADETLNAGKAIWRRWGEYEAARTRQTTAAATTATPRRTEQPYATGSAIVVEHDAARLDYDGEFYRLTMRRLLRNTGDVPITRYLIRISVDRHPGDPERSNAHYRLHPLTWDELALTATFEEANFQHATFEDFTRFSNAIFEGNAFLGGAAFRNGLELEGVIFRGAAWFDHTVFGGYIDFHSAQFHSAAHFDSATFEEVRFEHATFEQTATFDLVTFHDVDFEYVTFKKTAYFEQTAFGNTARFAATEFREDARFDRATFARVTSLGPFLCRGELTLSGAVFESPVVLMAVARRLVCHGTRWASTAALRLRYATVDFSHAAIEYPLSISTESSPLAHDGDWIDWILDDDALTNRPGAPASSGVAISSLHGVDTAHLVLTDVDVSSCVFTGAVHLDQLRLDGACTFNRVPTGIHWQRWRPVKFTRRRTLGEENHWRARQPHAVTGWDGSTSGSDTLSPTQLAPVYRALRKSFEDSKNESGAADFYYGEMAMRQRDPTTPPTERGLLAAYWALSGYGLRASRAFGWLLVAMTITVLAMMVWGIPRDDPNPASTGTVTGQNIRLVTETPDPVNPTGAELTRLTSDRFEKSLRVVINSVIFRSSGQDLTTAGTYVEMASRLTEPVLLGLGILAIRGRVKR